MGQYFEIAPEEELLLEELLDDELLELELLEELLPELELEELELLEELDEELLELLEEASPPPQPLSSREPKSVMYSADNLEDLRMVEISLWLYFYEVLRAREEISSRD